VLVGPRASGKTSLGRALASHLGWRFWDGDEEFERRLGAPVGAWLRRHGEPEFRRQESAITVELLDAPRPFVAALGGGAVVDPAVRQGLRRHRRVALLLAPPVVLARRILGSSVDRPPLTDRDTLAEVEALLAARLPFYRQVATVQIDTSHGEVADWLRALLASPAQGS